MKIKNGTMTLICNPNRV